VDAVCLDLLEAKRKEARVPAIGANADHIENSARLAIGQADRTNIEIVEVAP
jgi:hypothetical protein